MIGQKIIIAVVCMLCATCLVIGISWLTTPYHVRDAVVSATDESTTDEATPDVATLDEATLDEINYTMPPSTEAPTHPATEYADDTPTERPTEVVVDESKETGDYDDTFDDAEDDVPPIIEVQDEPQSDSDGTFQDSPLRDDVDLLARVIWAEAGNCSEECQWLVASATMNLADYIGDGTLESIVFDTSVVYISNDTPSSMCYRVAARVIAGDRDYNVFAFRTNHYHDFGTPYKAIDNVFFSAF